MEESFAHIETAIKNTYDQVKSGVNVEHTSTLSLELTTHCPKCDHELKVQIVHRDDGMFSFKKN